MAVAGVPSSGIYAVDTTHSQQAARYTFTLHSVRFRVYSYPAFGEAADCTVELYRKHRTKE